MDLQVFGNKQENLLEIETKAFYLTLTGKKPQQCEEVSEEDYTNEVIMQNPEELITNTVLGSPLMLFEYTHYHLTIESKVESHIEFNHDNKEIRDSIKYTNKRKKTLTGILNFRSSIGLTDLEIYVDHKKYMTLRLEVFPSKLNYKKDYYDILRDVNEEIYNLSFEFLRRTYLNVSISGKEGNSLTEYYSILRQIYRELMINVQRILQQPHRQLSKFREIRPYHKIKKASAATIKWIQKNPEVLIKSKGNYLPRKALAEKKEVTFDTYENRFLKYMLVAIMSRLKEFKIRYGDLQRERDDQLISEIDGMIDEIRKQIQRSFLQSLEPEYTYENLSLVLKMAPGYREVYKYHIMLQKGLVIQGDLFNLSMKDLAELYEYWCFIKINQLLRKKYKLLRNDYIKINPNGIFVTLKKGVSTKVIYENPENGEKFEIGYNQKMASKTIGQKPDNVFSIGKDGGKVVYEYIFDAKYRLNKALPGSRYKNIFGSPGPEESDINTMHRYRDSIVSMNVSKQDHRRKVFGAYVLFPYDHEAEFENHKLYKSIDLVNVGGMPFLPNSTVLVEKFLDELISESSYTSYERGLELQNREAYLKEEFFNKRVVLVGALKNEKQLEFNLKNQFYHTPLKNIDLTKRKVNVIALAQSKKLFKEQAGIRYYGKVSAIHIVKRSEIHEIPKDSDELYVKFTIESWKTLESPLKVEGFQVSKLLYTTEYLLKNSKTVSDLMIQSKEEFRLWMELKTISTKVETIEKAVGNKIEGFKVGNKEILVDRETIKVLEGQLVETYPLSDMINRPRTLMKLINN